MIAVLSMLVVMLGTFSTFQNPTQAATFSDINNTFAKDYIAELGNQGIIDGFDDGTFRPNEEIKRVDFAKMITLALDLPMSADSANAFTDVPDRAKQYVGALVDAGITNGKKPGYFGASDYITRQEMIIMFVRAMGMEDFALNLNFYSTFEDEGKISGTAYPYVAFAEAIGFAEGDKAYNFAPQELGKRSAAAKWIYFYTMEQDLYFENALRIIGIHVEPTLDDVTLINNDTVELTYLYGTKQQSVVDFWSEMYDRLQYQNLIYWTGVDWNLLTEEDKQGIAELVAYVWGAGFTEFTLMDTEQNVADSLKSQLDNFYVNATNNEEILIVKIIELARAEGFIIIE